MRSDFKSKFSVSPTHSSIKLGPLILQLTPGPTIRLRHIDGRLIGERKASKAIEYKQKASKVNERCRDPGKTTPSCVGSDSQKPVMNERNCADSSGAKRCQINFVKPAISTDVKTEMTMEVSRNRKTVNQYDKMKNHLSKQWLVHKIPIPDKIKTGLTVSSAKPVSDGAGRHKVLVGKVESPQLNSVVDTEHLSDDEMLNKKTEPACSTEDRFIDKEERRNIEDRFTSRDASMYIFRQAIRKESATGQSSIIPGHSSISGMVFLWHLMSVRPV